MDFKAHFVRCRWFLSRHRIILSVLTTLTVVFLMTAWALDVSRSSPRVSFHLFKVASFVGYSPLVKATADYDSLVSDLAKQMFANAIPEFSAGNLDPAADDELKKTHQLLSGVLLQVVPAAMRSTPAKSLVEDLSKNSQSMLMAILPAILKVEPSVFNQWFTAIRAGDFGLGECRVEGSRAACEVMIQGPDAKRVQIVSLWTQNGFMWRVERILGLETLFDAMR